MKVANNYSKTNQKRKKEVESPLLEKQGNRSCAMSGWEEDFLHMYAVEESATEKKSSEKDEKPSRLNKFNLRETDFKNQLRLWRKDVTKENPNNKDLLMYLLSSKQEKIDLIMKDVEKYGAMKITFGTLVHFKREKNGLLQTKRHWFHEQEPHIFTKSNIDEIGEEYDKYIEWVMGQVSAWNKKD